jgi:hypothetical protein
MGTDGYCGGKDLMHGPFFQGMDHGGASCSPSCAVLTLLPTTCHLDSGHVIAYRSKVACMNCRYKNDLICGKYTASHGKQVRKWTLCKANFTNIRWDVIRPLYISKTINKGRGGNLTWRRRKPALDVVRTQLSDKATTTTMHHPLTNILVPQVSL